jgi:hypothetical protein
LKLPGETETRSPTSAIARKAPSVNLSIPDAAGISDMARAGRKPEPTSQARPIVRDEAYGPLAAALLASIFLQRFALPVGEDAGIAINLMVTLAALLVIVIRSGLSVEPLRLVLFSVFMLSAAASFLLNESASSRLSFAYLIVLYLPFTLILSEGDSTFRSCLGIFQSAMLACGIIGIAQFWLQFAVPNPLVLFTFEGLLPSWILLQGYDNLIPLMWGSTILKSNGFFFIEPSTFSQYLALAIVFELLFFQRLLRLSIYVCALLFSYSGTGLLLLVILGPAILVYRRSYRILGLLSCLLVVAVLAGDYWHMEALTRRLGEFGSAGSSATARFVAGLRMISEQVTTSTEALLGFGSGTYRDQASPFDFEVHDPPYARLVFEYGILGVTAFFAFLLVSLFGRSPSRWVAGALLVGFMTFGGMLLDPRLHVLMLVFCVLPTAGPEADVSPP